MKTQKKHKRGSTEVDKYVGERLRAGRNAAGMSQAELGEALGVSFQQVQKYERGTNRVSCGALVVFAAALKVEVGWFFEGCPGVGRRRDPEAMSVTQFFQENGAAELAEAFIKLDTRHRAIVRNLVTAL